MTNNNNIKIWNIVGMLKYYNDKYEYEVFDLDIKVQIYWKSWIEDIETEEGQKLIAKYIIDHYDKAAFYDGNSFRWCCGKWVDGSKICNWTYILYQNCKVIQELIRSKLTAVQRIEIASERIEYNDIM